MPITTLNAPDDYIIQDGDLQVVSAHEALRQRVLHFLRFHIGESIFNPGAGVPYRDAHIRAVQGRLNLIRQRLVAIVLGIEGVASVNNVMLVIDDRDRTCWECSQFNLNVVGDDGIVVAIGDGDP